MPTEVENIPGAAELRDWFGYWPGFHDAEIVSLHLNRNGVSFLLVHTWEMTKQVDEKGHYVLTKHIVVEFLLENISALSLTGFSHQNVIFGLDIEKTEAGFRLTLDECYGLSGSLEAESLSVRLKPGKPL